MRINYESTKGICKTVNDPERTRVNQYGARMNQKHANVALWRHNIQTNKSVLCVFWLVLVHCGAILVSFGKKVIQRRPHASKLRIFN